MSNRKSPVDIARWPARRPAGPGALEGFLASASTRESPLKQRLRNETRALGAPGRMMLDARGGALLAFLVRLTGARRVLEIGTFTGYSSLCMAEALPADGKLVACDVSQEWTAIARAYWEEAGIASRIELHLRPALETLAALEAAGGEPFDMAFIDADKENYPAYLRRSLGLLRPGGLVAVDNIYWGGAVGDPEINDPETQAIRDCLRQAADDPALDHAVLPVGDGLLLVHKR